ncbi:hypothetical protein P9G78_17805 [Bacillus subtilis]|uniref:DUF7394 family protein n=1 Tax=Bacillus subtilis TaxID=1423 RepID=UPI002DBA650D|nr:hypothetical protein [Bacillus subtilis]MEC2236626.1 hypothetical protein [Bacillus subtilis]
MIDILHLLLISGQRAIVKEHGRYLLSRVSMSDRISIIQGELKMTSIFLAVGGVAVVCSAGTGLAAALKWFHNYEPDVDKKKKTVRETRNPNRSRLDDLSKKVRTDNHL